MKYIQIYGMMCCGTLSIGDRGEKTPDRGAGEEIHSIQFKEPRHILEDICESRYFSRQRSAFYVFTDNANGSYGDILMGYIHEHKLGEVIRTKGGRNPNSGNIVVTYVWRVNEPTLYAYAIDKTTTKIPEQNAAVILHWIARYGNEYGEDNECKPQVVTPHKYPRLHHATQKAKKFIESALLD